MIHKLTWEQREKIRRRQTQPPVDVGALAQDFGINVWESEHLRTGMSGKLFRDPLNGGESGFSIVVRASEPFVRRRFTVAHEIAHYLLHRDAVGDGIYDDSLYRSGLGSRREAEANALAAEILMPQHIVEAQSSKSVPQLAKDFQVSEMAISFRLNSLRKIWANSTESESDSLAAPRT